MSDIIISDTNIQTVMIVWDFNLKIVNKGQFDIFTPVFSLNSTETDMQNWIRLDRLYEKITISSNFSSIKELKRFTTYVINLSTNTVLDVYKGFGTFSWNHNKWIDKMKFVFELEMQCASPAPIIWKYCTSEIKSPINTNGVSLSLDSETSFHTVLNNQGVACAIKRYRTDNEKFPHGLTIRPEEPPGNWNLFIVMLRKEDNNVLGWYYLHLISQATWSGKFFSRFEPLIILEINEVDTSLKDMSLMDIAAIVSVIKPGSNTALKYQKEVQQLQKSANLTENGVTETRAIEEPTDPAIQRNVSQQMSLLSELHEYFVDKKYCDIAVQVGDDEIRAHKLVLATGSPKWRNLIEKEQRHENRNQKLMITDFDYETIKQLIEYMYTGKTHRVTDQLLVAADKFGVTSLKDLCEEHLIELINMETIVNVLVLADQHTANALFGEAVKFIRENFDVFMKLKESIIMFKDYPDLAAKLFARI